MRSIKHGGAQQKLWWISETEFDFTLFLNYFSWDEDNGDINLTVCAITKTGMVYSLATDRL